MNAPLTKSKIDSFLPGPKDVFVWDTTLPGFGLKITPSGHKAYLLQYRLGGRATAKKRYTIGTHGTFTPDQARKEAVRLRGLIASGHDPAEAKAQLSDLLATLTEGKEYLSWQAAHQLLY